MSYFLKILAGPRADQVGLKIPLVDGANLVGRVSPPCSIHFDGKKVSKKHCTFHIRNGQLSVEDHESSNGVYLNGKKISQSAVKDKDRLVIGEYTVEVTVG